MLDVGCDCMDYSVLDNAAGHTLRPRVCVKVDSVWTTPTSVRLFDAPMNPGMTNAYCGNSNKLIPRGCIHVGTCAIACVYVSTYIGVQETAG